MRSAIILAGRPAHAELIKNLKQRGYYTVLVDYLDDPPAKSLADIHIQKSAFDSEVVLGIAKKYNAELVISTSMDFTNVVACEVAEKLGLPTPYSAEDALYSTRKDLMKDRMAAFSIPSSRYVVGDNWEEVKHHSLQFPIIVKPVDRSGGFGVHKVNSPSEAQRLFNEALLESRMHRALMEEFIEGDQISVDCFTQNGHVEVLLIRYTRINGQKGEYSGLTFGAVMPAQVSEKAKNSIHQIAKKIVVAYQLKTTFFLIQATVDNNNNVNVIELTLRIGGGASNAILRLVCGFDPIDAMVNSFLSFPIDYESIKQEEYWLTRILFAKEGKFEAVEGHRELIEQGVIEEFSLIKKLGSTIDKVANTRHRVAYLIIKGNTLQEVVEKEQYALSKIEAYDENNEPMLINEAFDDKRRLL